MLHGISYSVFHGPKIPINCLELCKIQSLTELTVWKIEAL